MNTKKYLNILVVILLIAGSYFLLQVDWSGLGKTGQDNTDTLVAAEDKAKEDVLASLALENETDKKTSVTKLVNASIDYMIENQVITKKNAVKGAYFSSIVQNYADVVTESSADYSGAVIWKNEITKLAVAYHSDAVNLMLEETAVGDRQKEITDRSSKVEHNRTKYFDLFLETVIKST